MLFSGVIIYSDLYFFHSVYGSPAIKYLDRPWNKHRAVRASTVQFNFLSYDELVPVLSRFRDNFPNVEHYEFTETNLHSMNQLNGLAHVQGITSLTINEEGNPIFQKNWRPYAIFRCFTLNVFLVKYINVCS